MFPGEHCGYARRTPGEIVPGWVRQFYHLFIGYLNDAGIDDIEDEEVICPPGWYR